jgi:hypothetical protein
VTSSVSRKRSTPEPTACEPTEPPNNFGVSNPWIPEWTRRRKIIPQMPPSVKGGHSTKNSQRRSRYKAGPLRRVWEIVKGHHPIGLPLMMVFQHANPTSVIQRSGCSRLERRDRERSEAMGYLRWAWRLWSNILTFEWLNRLSIPHPRLGYNIKCVLWSAWMGIAAWYYLDPRFRLFEKNRYIETSWTLRILTGSVLLGAAVNPLILFVFFKARDSIEFQWPQFRRWMTKRTKAQ